MKPRASYNSRGRGNGRSNTHDRGGGSDDVKASTTTGLIAELPVLTWTGKQSNYADFKDKVSTYLKQQFGNNGSFIANDRYYEPTEPIEPDADSSKKASRRDQIMWSVYEDEMKSWTKVINKNLEDRTKMYEIIWGQLSNQSKEKIRSNANFADAEVDEGGRQDPLALWKIIASTHLVLSTGSDLLDRAAAKNIYDRIRQGNTESLGDFKLRFDRAIEALDQLGHTNMPETPEQVIHFINALHPSQHFEWKTKTLNGISEGEAVPTSVVDAYEKCVLLPFHGTCYWPLVYF